MNKKNILLSTLLIGLLICLVLFKLGFFTKKNSELIFNSEINEFCLNDFCLDKKGDKWLVIDDGDESEARMEVVKVYLGKFKTMKLVDLVSENMGKIKNYGMEDDNKLILTINSKRLEIGGIGGDMAQTYIRQENGEKIYTTNVLIDKRIIREKNFWQLNH